MTHSGLRVAMFTPWKAICGISDYSRNLVDALKASGDISDVTIVEPPDVEAQKGYVGAIQAYAGAEALFRDAGDQLREAATDLVHIQHQYFFFGGVAPHKNHAKALLNRLRPPVVMTVHEIAEPTGSASVLVRQALKLTNRANFLHPVLGRFIVHTSSDRARLVFLGVSEGSVRVIPVGVPRAEPAPAVRDAKELLGLTGKTVITLFGFISAKKGHRVAIDAIRKMPDDVVLLIAGDQHPDDRSEYVPGLRAMILAEGLGQRVIITGYLPDDKVSTIMAATDIAVCPFTQSSGSASLAHLFAYGKAIVASDIEPHREIVQANGECIALFRSGDADDLKAQLLQTLGSPALRDRLQVASAQYAARHSYANMAAETAAVYRELV